MMRLITKKLAFVSGAALTLWACDNPPTQTTVDPLKRKYTTVEHAGFAESSKITKDCTLERKIGGLATANGGATLVASNCAGVITTYATDGDIAAAGQIDLHEITTSGLRLAHDAAIAQGSRSFPTVTRIEALNDTQIVVFHRGGYDVVDVSNAATPTVVKSNAVLRAESTRGLRTLSRQQIPDKTGDSDYTLEQGVGLDAIAIESGCVLQGRFAVVNFHGYQTRERDSVLTGLLAADDPLSLGGSQVFDIESGQVVTHLAGSQFGPRSCEANDNGVVMFADEEDSGIYPYTSDIFVQLGFREFIGAVFLRVAEVFGNSIEQAGGALGSVIDALTVSGELAGLGPDEQSGAGPLAVYPTIGAALEQSSKARKTVVSDFISSSLAAYFGSNCPELDATHQNQVRAALAACSNKAIDGFTVPPTDPAGVGDAIEATAGAYAALLGTGFTGSPDTCTTDLAQVAGCTSVGGNPTSFVTDAAQALGGGMQQQLFNPVFTLSANHTLAAFHETAVGVGDLANLMASNDVLDLPGPADCGAYSFTAPEEASIRGDVASCIAANVFTASYSPTFADALTAAGGTVGDPGSPMAPYDAVQGCLATATNITTLIGGHCGVGPTQIFVGTATALAAQGGLFALYIQFGLDVAEAVGLGVGEQGIGGVALHQIPAPADSTEAAGIITLTAGLGIDGRLASGDLVIEAGAVDAIKDAASAGAATSPPAIAELLAAHDIVFRSGQASSEVWNAGPLRTMMWDEAGLTSRDEIDMQNYAAFRAMPPLGDDWVNKYTFDLIHPQRGAKYVRVYGSRDSSTDASEDASIKGMRAMSYVIASSECFDVNKSWNAPRRLLDGPVGGATADLPAFLDPQNLQKGGVDDGDLENPDALVRLYKWDGAAWSAGPVPAGDGDPYMASIAALHKASWDTWTDRNPLVASGDKAAVKALVSGGAPQLNEGVDEAFACSSPSDFSSPYFTCMLCQPRFIDLVSVKFEKPSNPGNGCSIKYAGISTPSTPSCVGRAPGAHPWPIEFTNGATVVGGKALTVNAAKSQLTVTVDGAPVVAEWSCGCEGDTTELICDGQATSTPQCLVNVEGAINVVPQEEAPETYASLAKYIESANKLSQGAFGKMHLVDLSFLSNNVSISAPTKPPTFEELTPADDPAQWDFSSRLVRKGRAAATPANPVRVDDQFGTNSDELAIQTRIFTNGVDQMAVMPGSRFFFGIEGAEGWDLFDTKDFHAGCENETNPEYKSSCYHNLQHFGFAISPAAKAFLSGIVSDDVADQLTSNLYLYDQEPVPILAEPFVGVNGGNAMGIDERTVVLTEGGTLGGRVWIYDIQALADGAGQPVEVYKESLLPGYILGGVAVDRAKSQLFIMAFKKDGSPGEDVRLIKITGDVPFGTQSSLKE